MDRTQHQKTFLLDLFNQALGAVSADQVLPPHLPKAAPRGRTIVLGAGKAAAAMAATIARELPYPSSGLVVTRYGHDCDISEPAIQCITAGHPLPDARGTIAAEMMLAMVRKCTPKDRIVFLASGGGSSTLCLPAPGLSLAQKQDTVSHLVSSGADIMQINCVRKHLSKIKGGRLAAVSGTQDVRTFIISDVPGDDPAAVASGPTIADPTSLCDARAVLAQYGTPHEDTIMALLRNKANETPKPGTVPGRVTIVATAKDALDDATLRARKKDWQVHSLGNRVEGEAREVGARHAQCALELKARGGRWLLLSGGETTVTVRNKNGCGGPNLEYLAGLALALNGEPCITALACDTDGIDGSEDNAGAFVTPSTLCRAMSLGISLEKHLECNQSYRFFDALDDLVITGPTRTNVNDFRAIAICS